MIKIKRRNVIAVITAGTINLALDAHSAPLSEGQTTLYFPLAPIQGYSISRKGIRKFNVPRMVAVKKISPGGKSRALTVYVENIRERSNFFETQTQQDIFQAPPLIYPYPRGPLPNLVLGGCYSLEFPKIQPDGSMLYNARLGEAQYMQLRVAQHTEACFNDKGEFKPYADKLKQDFPTQVSEDGRVHPNFGGLLLSNRCTGKSTEAGTYRKLGEAYFKRAFMQNRANEQINLINKEEVNQFDLAILERKELVVPSADGFYDFETFYEQAELKNFTTQAYDSRLRPIASKRIKYRDWIPDNL